jgi:hypothetical protein
VGRYGRPKLPAHKRRDAATLNIRLNQEEREIVEEKARDAGITVHEWARFAALERHPPLRPIVPEINHAAWLQTGELMETLTGTIHRLREGRQGSLLAAVEGIRAELATVRNLLLGGQS